MSDIHVCSDFNYCLYIISHIWDQGAIENLGRNLILSHQFEELGKDNSRYLTFHNGGNFNIGCNPRGLALKIVAQRLFPSDKFMGVFWGLRQVNALRGVFGGDGVKRVVCRWRWECFGCFIEGGAFWGVLIPSYLHTIIRWFMGVLMTITVSQLYFG